MPCRPQISDTATDARPPGGLSRIWRRAWSGADAGRLGGLLGALLLAGAGVVIAQPAAAQFFDNPFVVRPPASVPAPSRSAPAWRPPDTFFGLPLGNPHPPPQVEQQPKRAPSPPPDPEGVVYASAADAVQGKKQPPTRFVLVIGDRYGRQIAEGLADTYVGERASPAVVAATDDPSGFMPKPVDWLTRLPAAIEAGKPAVTVLALGSDDLEPIRDGDTEVPPLSERWDELYGKRVDDILAAARGQNRRVILVGLAPVQSTAQSADYERLNEVLRAHAARGGAVFVNVWDGFVDEEGKYMASGPAVDGQRRRLRVADGTRFTRAGTRKLAFFVQKELSRMLAEPSPADAPAADGSQPISLTDGPRGANALLGGVPGPAGRATPAPTPASAGGTDALRVLVDGAPLAPQRGRTDDFSWPPSAPAPKPAESAPAPAPAAPATAAPPAVPAAQP
ncbi:SGNH/GDSL hydrolase family protein [Azorhizobium doebereinerae]|uniref:SGNH/GDSL hydrolase family protein n=1 Tax=Azorhizobium doebereinerae TaxID=281091 RepID=UPI000405460D|nr:DUF459 domain-containing protein [Azorhizobium doebereinerae]